MGGQASQPQFSQRFTPVSPLSLPSPIAGQSRNTPQQGPGGSQGGFNLSDLSRLLSPALGGLKQYNQFSGGSLGGSTFNQGVGALTGALGLAQGIEGGNIPQSIGGAANLGSNIASFAGYPGIGQALGAIGGPLSLAMGAQQGNLGGIIGGIAPTMSALGSGLTAASTAGSGAATAGAGLSAAAGAIALPAAIAAVFASRQLAKRAEQKMNQARERGDITQNASVAFPKVQAGTQAVQDYLTKGGDIGQYRQQAVTGLVNAPYLSQFVDTQGGKGSTGIPGQNTGYLTKLVDYGNGQSDPLYKAQIFDNTLNLIRLTDAMARQGQGGSTDLYDLQRMANWMVPTGSQGEVQSAVNQGFYAGNMENAILDYYGRTNPQAAQSYRSRLAGIPQIPLNLPPQQIQSNLAHSRNLALQEAFNPMSRLGPNYTPPAQGSVVDIGFLGQTGG